MARTNISWSTGYAPPLHGPVITMTWPYLVQWVASIRFYPTRPNLNWPDPSRPDPTGPVPSRPVPSRSPFFLHGSGIAYFINEAMTVVGYPPGKAESAFHRRQTRIVAFVSSTVSCKKVTRGCVPFIRFVEAQRARTHQVTSLVGTA